jgi:hypothetical protein
MGTRAITDGSPRGQVDFGWQVKSLGLVADLAFMRIFVSTVVACGLMSLAVGCSVRADRGAPPRSSKANLLDPATLVLSPADVGAGYAQNGPATHPATLTANERSGPLGAELQREYIAGYVAGYPATSAHEPLLGLWCSVKVYKTSLSSWYTPAARKYFKHHRKELVPIPADAPGTPLALLVQHNVHIAGYTATLVLFTWAEGRVASEITVSGRPGDSTSSLVAALMRLAKIQDAKIRMAS